MKQEWICGLRWIWTRNSYQKTSSPLAFQPLPTSSSGSAKDCCSSTKISNLAPPFGRARWPCWSLYSLAWVALLFSDGDTLQSSNLTQSSSRSFQLASRSGLPRQAMRANFLTEQWVQWNLNLFFYIQVDPDHTAQGVQNQDHRACSVIATRFPEMLRITSCSAVDRQQPRFIVCHGSSPPDDQRMYKITLNTKKTGFESKKKKKEIFHQQNVFFYSTHRRGFPIKRRTWPHCALVSLRVCNEQDVKKIINIRFEQPLWWL